MLGKLYGIGVGPGDPELVTLKAVRVMKACDVIAIPGKEPAESTAYAIACAACPEIKEKEYIYISTPMTKNKKMLDQNYLRCAEEIEALLEKGKTVGLLTIGDPTIYSTYIYMHRIIQQHGYETEIVNGIPSFCACSARIGDSLVDRQEQLHIIPASYQIADALLLPGTKVFMKAGSKLRNVKEMLQENGQKAIMAENCGMAKERIYESVAEFPKEASYYSLIIVKEA